MKFRIIRMLVALTFIFILLGIYSAPAYAASCYNVTCEDLNPNTMGCGADAVTAGSVKVLSDGGNNQSFVETRKSAACVPNGQEPPINQVVIDMQQQV